MTNKDKPTELTSLIVRALKDATIRLERISTMSGPEIASDLRQYRDLLKRIEQDQLDVTFYSRSL